MNLQCPITKILLPVDGSENCKRAVQFSGCLGQPIGKSLAGITLLHAIGGGYLSRHMANVDFRTEVLMHSEIFKKIKEEYTKKEIMPFLDEAEKILKDRGIKVKIEKFIVDGDPANEIIHVANDGNFSTIIMARRGHSKIKEFLLGEITSKVVYAATRQTVYIVGHKIVEEKACPITRILVPVDGSSYSLKGVEHAGFLIKNLRGSVSAVTLLRVINLALYTTKIQAGIDPEEEANKILDEAKAALMQVEVPKRLIKTKVRVGAPAEEILKEAEEDYDLIIMGRKGRTALKDLIIGGVSSTVLQRTHHLNVAIMSSE